jgi:tol-pal system protein YbgF
MRHHLLTSIVGVALALAALPAAAANKDIERLYVQVAALQSQIADLQRTAEESQREIKRLTDLLAEQNAFFRKSTQDRRLQDEALQTTLRELTERMGELDARLQSQAAAAAAAAVAAATPPAPIPSSPTDGEPAAGSPATAGAVPVAPTPAPTPAVAPPPARELYSQAYADYTRGNYDLALQGYREYLRYYPDTELSDNAQYWIGESLYAKKQFAEAVEAWDELLRQYPASDKLPDGRFKRAMALERLGRRREALGEYRAVAERYPNSEAGRKAKEKLSP